LTVFCGPSIWREMNVITATRVMVAMSSAPQAEKVIWAPLWNDALIGRSRSIMCTEFLKTDADVMVIIDDDIVFEAEDFWKIVEGARETRSIYGGGYVTRSTEPHLTSRVFPNTTVQWAQGAVRRPLEIQYLATGFFAIHRDLMEAMIGAEFEDADGSHKIAECQLGADRPFFPFFSPFQVLEEDGRRHYLSEDWAFCNRARQLGFKVWMDQSIILQHLGLYPYTVADLNNPGNAFPSRGIAWAEMTSGPQTFGDPILDNLLEDIAEWAGEDLGDVRRMVEHGAEQTSQLFESKPVLQTEAEWYAREDVGMAYIADLASWHLKGCGSWTLVAGDLAGKTVLDFGSGISTWGLVAARQGAEVYAFEPNPVMREFAAWRADKYGLSVRVIDEVPQGPDQHDVIVAWHVFEHLEQPEETLATLLRALKLNGALITESGFDDHLPAQHHEHSDWAGALARAGLVEVAPATYKRAAEVAGVTAAELAGVA
jgi:SAM-dependent methyltransferase